MPSIVKKGKARQKRLCHNCGSTVAYWPSELRRLYPVARSPYDVASTIIPIHLKTYEDGEMVRCPSCRKPVFHDGRDNRIERSRIAP